MTSSSTSPAPPAATPTPASATASASAAFAIPAPASASAPFPEDPIVRATGLSRRYGRGASAHLAVDAIDLEIRRGELFGLLGTNGAGKTSTLEVLEGLARPTGGSVEVFGLDPFRERRRVRPRQGLMLQSGGFPADLTTAEALAMWTSTLSAPRTVADLLAEVDLADRAGTRISSLSGGEVRRLDLACAIAGDPELLFLDEPTTGLDPESRARAWELIARLKERGTTIVLTTHYLDEAESLADRLAIMHRGRIVREGTVADVVAGHPATLRATLPEGVSSGPAAGTAVGPAAGTAVGPAAGTADARTLPPLVGAHELVGRRLEVRTPALQDDLHALLGWAHEHRIALEGLDARAASLESVFLEIAGSDADGASAPAAVPATPTTAPTAAAITTPSTGGTR
ncbi:ABC transporter ATP-binding protein [Brachybacterium sp. DNPG3]